MKNKKIRALAVLSLASLMGLSVTACGGKTPSSSDESTSIESGDTGTTSEGKELILLGVNKKATFAAFEANKGVKENKDEEFIDRSQNYTVGDDNTFNVKPILEVIDDNGNLVDQSGWDHDYKIKVQVKNGDNLTDADSSLYEIADARSCDVQFKELAVGKTFVITVTPGGLSSEDEADPEYSQVITVDVVDGYNVYKAVELGYYDQREGDDVEEESHSGDNKGLRNMWDAFKEEKGLQKSYYPASLIFQDNITVTKNDLPGSLFYTADDLKGQPDQARSTGSMRDDVYVYTRLNNDEVTINGNYFKLDYSAIPLVTREWGKTTAEGTVVSHSSLFRMRDGVTNFKNINITGNAKKAQSDSDTIYGGGLMLAKAGARANAVNAENIISRKCFITFMSEDVDEGEETVNFTVKNSIGTDNYNSFFYNWGGQLLVENSRYGGCGGPILIQDHVDTPAGKPVEDYGGYVVYGQPSHTIFKNCSLVNYVAGSEAWFIQFNATTLVPGIKQLSDLYAQFGKSYVVDSNHRAGLFRGDGTDATKPLVINGTSFFNFIALNKDSGAQGATDSPACGRIDIINDEMVQTYDYIQPAADNPNFLKAMEIQQALLGAQSGTVSAEELMALAQKYGVSFVDQDTLIAGLTQAAQDANAQATADATPHGVLRAIQANGAPVFQSGNGFGYYDGAHQYMQPMMNAATGSYDPMTTDDPFVTGLSDTTCLYFNSMMLVFGLQNLGA